ncbi:hypothetical protein ACFW6E_37550 [Streptomyces olivaceoviridis]|uniref:hypothetical protein n=1 Tax=Streptomyces olivaceoviridis TaxID=1921 RepID=UPI0036B26813
MDELWEEADRVQAELATSELEWQEWVIARRRVDTVLARDGSDTGEGESVADPQKADAPLAAGDAAKPKSQVPVWHQGLAWSVLKALTDRGRLDQRSVTGQEMAAAFGMDVVPAWVEALRSEAKRLVTRGWMAEPARGRFMLARAVPHLCSPQLARWRRR